MGAAELPVAERAPAFSDGRLSDLDEAFLYLEMVKQLYNWGTRVHEEAPT